VVAEKDRITLIRQRIRHTLANLTINQEIGLIALLILLIYTIRGVIRRELYLNFTQLIFSSLYLGALYLCLSLGLTLTYKLIGFANFGHAEYFLVGAYVGVAWSYTVPLKEASLFDIVPVLLLAFVIAGITALISDFLVFRPLRKRDSSPETLMISSIGVGIVIRNVISLFYGGKSQYFRWYDFSGNNVSNTITLPSIQLGARKNFLAFGTWNLPIGYFVTIIVTAILVGGLIYMLQSTKIGKALRATADNKDLAESSGINTELMIWIVWFVGGGLAGVAGVLFTLSFQVIPFTGFLYLLPAFAVVVFGGVGSLKGSVFASIIIAAAQQISVAYLNSFEDVLDQIGIERTGLNAYQIIVPFIVIIAVLLFKPYGLYGEEEEVN